MIPTHHFPNKGVKPIRINELESLMEYDATMPHRHHYYEFFVFNKGGGVHLIDFVEYPILDGSIHIVSPGQVHQVRRELDSNGFVFLFEAEVFHGNTFISNFLNEHQYHSVNELSPCYHFDEEIKHRIENLSKSVWSDYNASELLKNEILLTGIMQFSLFCMNGKNELKSSETNKNSQIYIAFRKLLHEQYKTTKKVSEYAQLLHISEKTLNSIIQSRTGETASQLISDQIILEAKRLLQMGTSVKEVAYELNFDDPAHFTKFFKTKVGNTPSVFQGR